ncbi:MAG: dihydroorotase [Treponema sp.]|jgi:dihydroorotase|nr:dihydroorotase [Treponema sp.]
MRLLLRNFRIVDAETDACGSVMVEDGRITRTVFHRTVFPSGASGDDRLDNASADMIIDGLAWRRPVPVLMPALVDLHAHFRDPGGAEKGAPLPAELLESACFAAAAGGYGTLVCMANTDPVIDTVEKAAAIKARADTLGLVDLYPAMSLTKGMAGAELSGITALPDPRYTPRLLSEDGRDVADRGLFLAALHEARRIGIPVSCHCDAGGLEAEAAKQSGQGREVWSRIEENRATERAVHAGREAGARVHIAHVSTREAAALVREAKAAPGGRLSAEASPHHLALTEEAARELGAESHGRVNPPLRAEADRQALIAAIADGVIDAIATDHAPHWAADKGRGAPGFSGLETAFSVCYTALVRENALSLKALSRLMSAAPACILGLDDRGRIAPGLRADFLIADLGMSWIVDPASFRSHGRNSPFTGRELWGAILLTIHGGRVVAGG